MNGRHRRASKHHKNETLTIDVGADIPTVLDDDVSNVNKSSKYPPFIRKALRKRRKLASEKVQDQSKSDKDNEKKGMWKSCQTMDENKKLLKNI